MTAAPAMLAAATGSGGLVGLVLGLFRGGGSILAVPLLVYVVGIASPHVAIGTSAVAASALGNLVPHARGGRVKWRCAAVFALAGVAGSLAGDIGGQGRRRRAAPRPLRPRDDRRRPRHDAPPGHGGRPRRPPDL